MNPWTICIRRAVVLSVFAMGACHTMGDLVAWQLPLSQPPLSQPPSNLPLVTAVTGKLFAAKSVWPAIPQERDEELESLVLAAMSDDVAGAEIATRALRQRGARALEYILSRTDAADPARWNALADTVAAQRDSHYSGLYWYTDLAAAQEASRRENKPILSLRLLGNLTDELSCANSRFFRTTLYPHQAVRSVLAERYVLHWETVRAVPIITIDFGDGRSIKRTITGNSLHLVLDGQGRTVDVLPGLYGAGFFARCLQESEGFARRARHLDDGQFARARASFHQQQLNDQERRWREDWAQTGTSDVPALDGEPADTVWKQLAGRYVVEAGFDESTQVAVQAKLPAEVAGRLAAGKGRAEMPILRIARNLVPVIAEDSVRNEYVMHRRIHQWFANGERLDGLALVTRIYSELFLSPLDDPWYGLSKPDVFSAVENDGRQDVVTTTQNSRY